MFNQKRLWQIGILIIFGSLLMSACNLGAGQVQTQPGEGELPTAAVGDTALTPAGAPVVAPQETTEPTQVPVVIPPTSVPTPQPLPQEEIGPIAIQGTEHRSQEPITITIRRGKAVSGVVCIASSQESSTSSSLGPPTSSIDIDVNYAQDTYTFTPEAAGTFSISCTGTATTATGETRQVQVASMTFTVQAKG